MASDISASASEYSDKDEHSSQSEEEYDELFTEELKAQEVRGKRSKKLPARYREAFESKEDNLAVELKDSKIRVKCNQTGKLFNVKVTALCKEDGDPVQRDNLVVGAQLIMTLNKKSYPVTLQKIITPLELQTDNTKSSSEKQKRPLTDKNTHPEAKKRKVESQGVTRKGALLESSKKPKSANKENLMAAKAELLKVKTDDDEEEVQATDKEILLRIEDKLDSLIRLEAKVDKLFNLLQGHNVDEAIGKVTVKEDEHEFVVDGVNLLRVPAKDACAYGRALLDLLFTKQEQKMSVVLKSKKTKKPPLDPVRVEKMFACIQRRYGNSYCHTTLMNSLNQKCRDAKPES